MISRSTGTRLVFTKMYIYEYMDLNINNTATNLLAYEVNHP